MKKAVQYQMVQERPNRKKKHSGRTVLGIFLVLAMGTAVVKIAHSPFLEDMTDKFLVSWNSMKGIVFGKNADTDWQLLLVNRWNPIPAGFDVKLVTLSGGHQVDERIYPDLQKMFDDARAEGILPMIYSSYRTTQKQQQLMEDEINKYRQEGYSSREAKKIAETWVARPGTSEHQIGLALDITSADKEAQEPAVVWEWLRKNSYRYGFILRYPEDKTDITGISSEPWHFRYVGETAAAELYQRGICLEEYLDGQ